MDTAIIVGVILIGSATLLFAIAIVAFVFATRPLDSASEIEGIG